MPCYHPLKGYYSRELNETGKRSLVFNSEQALFPVSISVPCGRCIGCRLDRSLMWALRCVHESKMHDKNTFITLTFDDSSVKALSGLCVKDFQDFMKRLRKFIAPEKVRFFHCGEYGSKLGRPHHHACLFGYDFPDKKLLRKSGKVCLYTSDILSKLWPFGFHTIGDVTFDSAAYVARYVLKKWSSENVRGTDLYNQMVAQSQSKRRIVDSKKVLSDCVDSLYSGKHPEYITMSRRPGIGAFWYDKYKSDVYPHGYAVLPSGVKVRPPKFYDSLFEFDNPFQYAILKGVRLASAVDSVDNTKARLEARESCQMANVNQLKRSFENDS